MFELAGIIFVAFLLDVLIGDPPYKYHPVRIIGRWILSIDKGMRNMGMNGKAGGLLLVVTVQICALCIYLTASVLLHHLYRPLGMAFDLFICYSSLALKDLAAHAKPVIQALEKDDLREAQNRIGLIVSREVQYLDEKGVSRAAVETLAENFVDGFVSPIFWYVAGGLLAFLLGFPLGITAVSFMLSFKVASTLDSMIGYKNSQYRYFGWTSAKLDDIMNFIPARLSLIILFFGAWISGLDPLNGLRAARRDRLKHDSPNAAHAESFFSGALGVRLCGPAVYDGSLKDKPWVGNGAIDPSPEHIRRAILLTTRSGWFAALLSVAAFVAFF
ncbi:MAG: adenosylcobinamide-phosphate synthase CbiB [Thermodesulfobacteriota bacterium]